MKFRIQADQELPEPNRSDQARMALGEKASRLRERR